MSRAGRRAVIACAAGVTVLGAAGCGGAARPVTPLAVTVAGHGLVPERATGVAIGRGRVLTVAHVLSGGPVRVAGRRARVLRSDHRLDVAVLAVPGLRAPAIALGGDPAGAEGIRVVRDGRPRSLPAHVRRRVIATVRLLGDARPRVRPALELSADVLPGDSGAPVVDDRGRALGFVFARSSRRADRAWAVDAAAVERLLAHG